MATFKFSHVEFRDAITMEELSVIYPTTFVAPWFYYYATAKTGEKVGIRNIIEDVNTGRRYVSSTRKTYGFVRDYNNELWNPGATIRKGGEIQSRLGITKDTTVRFIDELYDPNTGAILARGVGTIPFKVMTPVTPDVIIDKVLIMDAETLRPVSEVRIDRNYYFQVHFRVKGSPPLTFKVRWDAVEGNKSFLLGETNWELSSYKQEYDEEWTATGYAVTGKWLIDMVNKNFTDHSKINVCCKIEWDWNGQHYVRDKCNSYPLPQTPQTPTPPPPTQPLQPKLVWKDFRIAINRKVIDPSTPIPAGTTISVLGNLWNEGNATANATVYLTINGREVKTARVTIPPGAYIPCGWDITLTEKGSHQICLDHR